MLAELLYKLNTETNIDDLGIDEEKITELLDSIANVDDLLNEEDEIEEPDYSKAADSKIGLS